MSYLNVPSGKGMARSASRESFATDISLLSLSSVTSDFAGSGSARCRPHPDDVSATSPLTAADRATADLAKDMLEQMLSCALPLPSKPSRRNSVAKNSDESYEHACGGKSGSESRLKICVTKSERDLLSLCARQATLARGSMYKSFSTGDLDVGLEYDSASGAAGLAKQYASQAWLPPGDCVRVLQCRKRHLKNMMKSQTAVADHDEQLFVAYHSRDDVQRRRRLFCRKAASEDDVQGGGGARKRFSSNLMKKLKSSKDLGRRIRDDLYKKMAGKAGAADGQQRTVQNRENATITKTDLEREKGRPLTQNERNFVIFHWLQSLDTEEPQSLIDKK